MPYEFFKGNEAPGREYFRCLGCRQYRDELKRQGIPIQQLPLVGSIIWLHNGKLVGDAENPGGHPHCCGGKFVRTGRRRPSNPIKSHNRAIISTIPLKNLIEDNASTSSEFQNSKQSSVPRITISSELIPGHAYTFQRFQHIYQAKPPFTYFNCLDCKRLCASKGKHYVPKLRLTPDGEILPWGSADKPHNGAHYCLGEEILESIGEANRIVQTSLLHAEQEFMPDINDDYNMEMSIYEHSPSSSSPNHIYETFKDFTSSNCGKANKYAKYEIKEEKYEIDRPTSTDTSSIGLVDAQNVSLETTSSLQSQINELRSMILTFQKASGINVLKKKLCIVQSRSRLTKKVEIEDIEESLKETYPHADVPVPIVKRMNPEAELASEERRARKCELEAQFQNIDMKLGQEQGKHLLLADSLLTGFDESSLLNAFIIRAEFPTIPSLVKMVLNNAFMKPLNRLRPQISTIFFILGYDMVRCYNEDSVRVVAKSIHTEIDDIFDILEDKDVNEENDISQTNIKTIVFVTIPEIGFLRERIEIFNATMRDKIKELQFYRRHAKTQLDILDWSKLVSKINTNTTVDERLQLLMSEMGVRYGLKLNL
uniref:Uncharacterized protein n=1 Tax=Acrobeloides nanus TaxID=290746 RepID=A0A914BVI0_9BILA